MINSILGDEILQSLKFFPVVSIIGPRQVGKTTLAKQIVSALGKPSIYLDLESTSDLFKLNAELFFSQH